MSPSTPTLLVITNAPDEPTATRIAEALVSARAAACVNIMGVCTSIYRWEGKIERAGEIPMFIKTTAQCYAAVQATIRDIHPYSVPEIIAVPVTAGLPEYLAWIADETVQETRA